MAKIIQKSFTGKDVVVKNDDKKEIIQEAVKKVAEEIKNWILRNR